MSQIKKIYRTAAMARREAATPSVKALEAQYYHLFHTMYDAVLMTDMSGKIIEANNRVVPLFQRDPDALIDTNVTDLISGANEELIKVIRATSEKVRSTAFDATCLRKDGSAFFADIIVSRLDDDTKNLLCFFIRDMTQRKQDEEQLKNANEMMIKAEKVQARIDTISSLLDVLNNPLQILTLMAEIDNNAEMKCQLDRINAVLMQLSCRQDLGVEIDGDGVSLYQLEAPPPVLKKAQVERILICDDERPICEALTRILENAFPCFTLDTVSNGQEAVDSFAANHHALIIMDLHMPVMNGLTAYREIASFCERNALVLPRFVFCTGFLIGEEINSIIGDGAFHTCIKKPFASASFLEMISSRLLACGPVTT